MQSPGAREAGPTSLPDLAEGVLLPVLEAEAHAQDLLLVRLQCLRRWFWVGCTAIQAVHGHDRAYIICNSILVWQPRPWALNATHTTPRICNALKKNAHCTYNPLI